MSKNIMVTDELYSLLFVRTNRCGGRDPKKVGFSKVIENALRDQELYLKRKGREEYGTEK